VGTYEPYDKGIEMDIFVKNISNQLMIGKVWNRKSTVWPDFTNEKTIDYWTQEFASFYSKIKFDGAWIDMNEPANMLNGGFEGCPDDVLEHPHYVPGGTPLSTKTMCMTAKHKIGNHYDVHSLYGLYEAHATNM
jgi:alpha-glucosidase, putative (fragment)